MFWIVLALLSEPLSTSEDPQGYLTQTSHIFLTPKNIRLISPASLSDLLQWAATKNQLREFGSHRWWSPQFLCTGEKIKDLVPYWHYAALSFSSGLLCFWGAFGFFLHGPMWNPCWFHMNKKRPVQPGKPHGLLQCMPALAKARVWLPAWPIT